MDFTQKSHHLGPQIQEIQPGKGRNKIVYSKKHFVFYKLEYFPGNETPIRNLK